ncbi:AAA family ATPase [Priestia taiwanensis]|uniref:Endonuclease GajA/Old nuclease/RecF-like AAA domain-containing protein n=1 Tax=Priestia taiwanensis TaxID=1347902 RepID=A0A917ERR8_9BACI|nr:ATP-binding protein [Priestia taiwanensis]MBM7364660.1 putative ATP-dependent endonuclease of OLD family [Priestia taiwanensis]GGE78594.1 hypothetical protein GCM10007140_30250 [Priestia taiwanensis]
MKVEWVRIKDFRSIEDTGKLYIDPMLTVLAGQNESGKSNILRALEVFSNGGFTEEDYPEKKSREKCHPMVEVSFKLDSKDFAPIPFQNEDRKEPYTWIMYKRLDSDVQFEYGTFQQYFFTKNDLGKIEYHYKEMIEIMNNTDGVDKELFTLLSRGNEFVKNFIEIDNPISWCREYEEQIENLYDSRVSHVNLNNKAGVGMEKLLDRVFSHFKKMNSLIENRYADFRSNMKIPEFKILSSFEQPLLDSTYLLDKNVELWSHYIKEILAADVEKSIEDMTNREIKRGLDRISQDITTLFQRAYSQNDIRLEFNVGVNNALDIYIYDGESDVDFIPSQRSKGFQWFLSFFFTMNAVQKKGDIILLDEIGAYLHPKAQNDVLKALELISKSNQIIFTTHSPYLINPDTLGRIRLVARDNENMTIIENKVHHAEKIPQKTKAQQDVYTPIMTAIGLDLSNSFGSFGSCNTIVEGISDYYYLEALKPHINVVDGTMRFIPSIGASKIDQLASLLMGWGINFKVLLDNDKAGNDERRELERDLKLTKKEIVIVSDKTGDAIEDLFSKADFFKYVLERPRTKDDEGKKNSSLLKKGKVLPAKDFSNKMQSDEEVKLSQETIDNFTMLFNKLYGVTDGQEQVEVLAAVE